jgi:hypothetical protein
VSTATTPKPRPKPKPQPKPPARTAPAPPSPGSLPQTEQLPSAATAQFHAEAAALWQGIRSDSPTIARPAFFPEGAYVQLKGIGDPQGDFTGRLLADFALDIGAAHQLLGAGAATAQLVSVDVPAAYAHWIPPGTCYNNVGYYEVPNSRLVYRENGQIASFGIASMISWRGVWYVVHLGAILRPAAVGQVDDPSSGSGYSAPSSTC